MAWELQSLATLMPSGGIPDFKLKELGLNCKGIDHVIFTWYRECYPDRSIRSYPDDLPFRRNRDNSLARLLILRIRCILRILAPKWHEACEGNRNLCEFFPLCHLSSSNWWGFCGISPMPGRLTPHGILQSLRDRIGIDRIRRFRFIGRTL